MKRFVYFVFFLMLWNFTTVVSKDRSAQSSLYAHYFLIKESIKAYIHSYMYDEQITQRAKIACNTCDYTMTSGYLWGHCASSGDEQILQTLMPLIYKGSTEELTAFLLASYEKLHIACPTCHEYQGWHIPIIN
jgi:hypothetical protein